MHLLTASKAVSWSGHLFFSFPSEAPIQALFRIETGYNQIFVYCRKFFFKNLLHLCGVLHRLYFTIASVLPNVAAQQRLPVCVLVIVRLIRSLYSFLTTTEIGSELLVPLSRIYRIDSVMRPNILPVLPNPACLVKYKQCLVFIAPFTSFAYSAGIATLTLICLI